MPFREKRAWISFVSIFLVSIVYFSYLILVYLRDPLPPFNYLAHLALLAISAFVLLEIALLVGLNMISSKEERMPKDERELMIEARATKIAYISLLIMSFIAAALVVHHPPRFSWLMGNLVILAIVLAELIKHGTVIVLFRRAS